MVLCFRWLVQVSAHDDATISFLLSQTLLAKQEAKEVEEFAAELAGKEQWLMTHIEQLRGRPDLLDDFSRLEMGVIGWFMIKREVMKKKGEKEEEGGGRKSFRNLPPPAGRCSGCRLRSTRHLDSPRPLSARCLVRQWIRTLVHLDIFSTSPCHWQSLRWCSLRQFMENSAHFRCLLSIVLAGVLTASCGAKLDHVTAVDFAL